MSSFELFLMLLGIFMVLRVVVAKHAKPIIKKERCPPHAWSWQPIKDEHGEVQGEEIVCAKCGPMRNDGSIL